MRAIKLIDNFKEGVMSYIESGYLSAITRSQHICYQELTEAFERLGYNFSSNKRSDEQYAKSLASRAERAAAIASQKAQ